MTEPEIHLTLSPRDVQWIAAALVTTMELLSAPIATDAESDDIAENCVMLHALYAREYSAPEINALKHRVIALLPADCPIEFVEPTLPASQTTLIS